MPALLAHCDVERGPRFAAKCKRGAEEHGQQHGVSRQFSAPIAKHLPDPRSVIFVEC